MMGMKDGVLSTISDHKRWKNQLYNCQVFGVQCSHARAGATPGGSSISSSFPSALIMLHELSTDPWPLIGQPLSALVPHLKMADSHQKETGPNQSFLKHIIHKQRNKNTESFLRSLFQVCHKMLRITINQISKKTDPQHGRIK